MRELVLAILLVTTLVGTGCTIRYSQTMVGEIYPIDTPPVASESTGLGIGIGTPLAGPITITFTEPDGVDELLDVSCDLALTQTDYRSTYVAFYLAVEIPKVEATSYCVK